jgi:hypothetical protein
LCLAPLIPFLIYVMIRMKRKPDAISGYPIIAVCFIIVFNMTDAAGSPAFLNVHVGKWGAIPATTLLLVLAFLACLLKSLVCGSLRLYTGSLFQSLAISCCFIILLMVLFYPLVRSLYPVSFEPGLKLINKLVKLTMIAILIADDVTNEIKFRKMSRAFLVTVGLIIILRILA